MFTTYWCRYRFSLIGDTFTVVSLITRTGSVKQAFVLQLARCRLVRNESRARQPEGVSAQSGAVLVVLNIGEGRVTAN